MSQSGKKNLQMLFKISRSSDKITKSATLVKSPRIPRASTGIRHLEGKCVRGSTVTRTHTYVPVARSSHLCNVHTNVPILVRQASPTTTASLIYRAFMRQSMDKSRQTLSQIWYEGHFAAQCKLKNLFKTGQHSKSQPLEKIQEEPRYDKGLYHTYLGWIINRTATGVIKKPNAEGKLQKKYKKDHRTLQPLYNERINIANEFTASYE